MASVKQQSVILTFYSYTMKRCGRCSSPQSIQPYREFSFEKSLRNYGEPRKMVKIDCGALRHSTIVNSYSEKQISKKEPISQSNYVKSPMKQNQKHLSLKNQAAVKQEDGGIIENILNLNSEEIKRNEKSEQNIEKVASNLDDFLQKTQTISQLKNQKEGQCVQSFKMKSHFQIEQSFKNSSPDQIKQSQQEAQHMQEEQGGRLYLNQKVSVSRRTLQKYMKKSPSVSDLVTRLLETRTYLKEDRQAVVQRLGQCLQGFPL